jgi:hypothetical protein
VKEKFVNENIKEELIKLKNLFDDGLFQLESYLREGKSIDGF